MKLSNDTLRYLKNFATINDSILVREGKVLKTMAPSKSLIGQVELEEGFPQTFAIYELGRLLSILSLFEAPEIE